MPPVPQGSLHAVARQLRTRPEQLSALSGSGETAPQPRCLAWRLPSPCLGGASREPAGALLPAQLVSLGGSVSGGPCCPTSRLSAAMRGPMTRRPFRPLPAGTGPAETLGTFGRGPLGAGLGDTRDDAVLIGKHTACAKSPGKGLLGASGPCKVGDFLFRVRLETIIVLKKHVLMAWN